MGMPCQVNSIVKLHRDRDYPATLACGAAHTVQKDGYRILPLDVPLSLVDEQWYAAADVVIEQLIWQAQTTTIRFKIVRLYEAPFAVKG